MTDHSNVDVYTVGELRIWRMIIAAPAPILSVNATHKMPPMKVSAWRKTWRTHVYEMAQAAHLPKHLARVHFGVAFHFTSYGHRDSLNYADTAKPVIDALGPPFVQAPTQKKPRGASAPGWSLIDDDDVIHVEDTSLTFGRHWAFITADNPTPENLRALDSGYGGITLVIGERPPLPPDHPEIVRPRPPKIDPTTRRAAALKGLIG